MAAEENLNNPWMVAVWPGMGSVAMGAGAYLVNKLPVESAAEISAQGLFDLEQVQVNHGLVQPAQMPRNLVFHWRDPKKARDLLIFIGEAQPQIGRYEMCRRLIEYAQQRGVKRVMTFAAMATQLNLGDEARVFAVATQADLLQELRPLKVEILESGQISGMNGLLLAAAAERGMEGMCLMGELPFFAVSVPNPAASKAVLEVFTRLTGIELDLRDLARQAKAVEAHLVELLEQMSEQTEAEEQEGETFEPPAPMDEPSKEPSLDPAAQQRIESLFESARRDRSRAFELKKELDRLGVFRKYEDRFLDLFKRAG